MQSFKNQLAEPGPLPRTIQGRIRSASEYKQWVETGGLKDFAKEHKIELDFEDYLFIIDGKIRNAYYDKVFSMPSVKAEVARSNGPPVGMDPRWGFDAIEAYENGSESDDDEGDGDDEKVSSTPGVQAEPSRSERRPADPYQKACDDEIDAYETGYQSKLESDEEDGQEDNKDKEEHKSGDNEQSKGDKDEVTIKIDDNNEVMGLSPVAAEDLACDSSPSQLRIWHNHWRSPIKRGIASAQDSPLKRQKKVM